MRKPKPLENETEAFAYALRLLARRAYTSFELEKKFRLRALPDSTASQVLDRLRAKKFLNDRNLAEQFVLSRADLRWSPFRIQKALTLKGIPREMLQALLQESFSGDRETQSARETLEKQKQRFLRKKTRKAPDFRRKAWEHLRRRGFSNEAARLAVKDVFGYNSRLPEEE